MPSDVPADAARLPRTVAKIIAQAEHLADLAETDRLPVGVWRDGVPMREMLAATKKLAEAEAEMVVAVEAARAEGYSWSFIGSMSVSAVKRLVNVSRPRPSRRLDVAS